VNHIKNISSLLRFHFSEMRLIYFVQLAFSLLIGIITYNVIDKYLGHSLAMNVLNSGFDRTVLMDVLNTNEGVLSPIIISIGLLTVVYVLVSVVLHGGFLYNIKKQTKGISSQLKAGRRYFLSFLGVSAIAIILFIIMATLIIIPYTMIIGDPLMTFYSEKPFVWSLIILIILFAHFLILIWAWTVSTKYSQIKEISFGQSIKKGFHFLKSHFFKILVLGYLLIGLHIGLAYLYFFIMGDRGASSWWIVVFGILVQQVFSFSRIVLRSFGYIELNELDKN